jgi:prepilin-type N-terminal cleavage/methylation domain-containing protein
MSTKRGFSLIELLIVIAIIAILAVVAFVSLDPLTRFQDARDSARFTDITAVLDGAKIAQVDNKGLYPTTVQEDTSGAPIVAGTVYMISSAATVVGCNDLTCTQRPMAADPGGDDDCVYPSELVTDGYLASIPVSPIGAEGPWTSAITGYYMVQNTNGSLSIGACENENSATSIEVQR